MYSFILFLCIFGKILIVIHFNVTLYVIYIDYIVVSRGNVIILG